MRITLLSFLAIIFVQCNEPKKSTNDDATPETQVAPVVVTAPTYQLTGQKWILKSLNDSAIDLVNNQVPYIEFNDTTKRISAYGGCNRMGGTYVLTENNGIKFEQMMSTKMACPNMQIEDFLGRAIAESDTYQINDNILMLQKGFVTLAEFTAE